MLIKDVRQTYDAIQGIMNKKLPIRMAFAIQKNAKLFREIVEFADNRQNEIVQKYAKRDESGKYVMTEDGEGVMIEDQESFIDEMDELAKTDMPLEFLKIAMSDVERCDEDRFDSLSPADLGAIDEMIEGE